MSVFGWVAAAIASAISAGLAVVTATVLALRTMQPAGAVAANAAAAATPDLRFFYFLVFGTLAGLVIAWVVAWILLAPIESTYRRGGLAMVCAFATVLCMVVAMPVEGWFGKPGLAALLAVSGTAATGFAWRARRAAIR